jgi:hypothetical protein
MVFRTNPMPAYPLQHRSCRHIGGPDDAHLEKRLPKLNTRVRFPSSAPP